MSSLKMIFLLLVFLLGGLWESEAVAVTGVLRKAVTIKCSHSNAFTNVKYFCKGACGDEDVLIRSSKNKRDSKGRYSIKDEGNTFNVTISGLTKDDSGTYWCGIERYGVDTYNEVILTVEEVTNSSQSNTNALSSREVVYIVAGLGVLVLTLAMVLLIFFRHRNRHINASPGKDHNTVYAAPSSQKQDGHHITTSCSTGHEERGTTGRTENTFSLSIVQHRDHTTATSESDTQPDGLFYSTVSFNKHTDCSSAAPCTALPTYSTIKHKAADGSVVYDNV